MTRLESDMADKTDEEAEQLERALKGEREQLREIGDEADAVDREINPPKPPIDHAEDGGII
jgi:hypothetical protein